MYALVLQFDLAYVIRVWFCSFQADKDVELAAKWKHCALTSEELKQPVVACELGM